MASIPTKGAVLCSGGASAFKYLQANDPNFGVTYQIVGVFSDVTGASGIEYAEKLGVPIRELNFKAWCEEKGVVRTDLKSREAYFKQVLEILQEWEVEFIILSGFMLRLTEPLLTAYAGRMLNVHPALLSITNESGARKYTGLNVVARAMQAGDPAGSTVHIVTDEPDTGPIVAESEPLPYKPGDDPGEHQERMKVACDGPAFQRALDTLLKSGWPANLVP